MSSSNSIEIIFGIISIFSSIKSLQNHQNNFPVFPFILHLIFCLLFFGFVPIEEEKEEIILLVWLLAFCLTLIDARIKKPVLQTLSILAASSILIYINYPQLSYFNWSNWIAFILTLFVFNAHILTGLPYFTKMIKEYFKIHEIATLISVDYVLAIFVIKSIRNIF